MTQEDKELLLKDLCARLPYGVKIQVPYEDGSGYFDEIVWEVNNDGHIQNPVTYYILFPVPQSYLKEERDRV